MNTQSTQAVIAAVGSHIQATMPEHFKLYQERYVLGKSMNEIGKGTDKSLQTVRNRLIDIWTAIGNSNPDLLVNIQSQSKDDLGVMFRDVKSYAGLRIAVGGIDLGEQKKLQFNIGKSANVNLMFDIKEALEAAKDKSPEDQLQAAMDVAGNRGLIASARFGIKRTSALTLADIGEKYSLTRERIRQISSSIAGLIFVAEQELEGGAITTLVKTIQSGCLKGGGVFEPLERAMQSSGLKDCCPVGISYLLTSIGMKVVTVEGVPYVHDPEMSAEHVIEAIKEKNKFYARKAMKERKARPVLKQIILVCVDEDLKALDERVANSDPVTNRGAFVSEFMTREVLEVCEGAKIEWQNPRFKNHSLRIKKDLFDMIEKVATERRLSKASLLNGALVHLLKPH